LVIETNISAEGNPWQARMVMILAADGDDKGRPRGQTGLRARGWLKPVGGARASGIGG